jgi:hypothetical protein
LQSLFFSAVSCFRHASSSRDESVSPRARFSLLIRASKIIQRCTGWTSLVRLFLERKMPKQLVMKAMKSPGWLVAVCFALWFAAHSFFAFLFVSATVAVWIKRSIKAAL